MELKDQRVSALLEEMKKAHIEPDIITYSTIVKGYCLSGDVDRAFEVLQEMRQDGKYAADEILYNSLLDGCAKQHRVEQAIQLLDDMRANGVSPSNYTLSILVKILGGARRLNEACSIIDDLCAVHGSRPNIHVYTCMAQACIQNGKLERAMATYDTSHAFEMLSQDSKAQIDQSTQARTEGSCEDFFVKLMEEANEEAGHKGWSPTVTRMWRAPVALTWRLWTVGVPSQCRAAVDGRTP